MFGGFPVKPRFFNSKSSDIAYIKQILKRELGYKSSIKLEFRDEEEDPSSIEIVWTDRRDRQTNRQTPIFMI